MTKAEHDREHGSVDDREAAIAAANRAGATVTEVEDDEARHLVAAWKARWDVIPKGWKADHTDPQGRHYVGPVGYPETEWNELRDSAQTAVERLGVVLRGLLERPK